MSRWLRTAFRALAWSGLLCGVAAGMLGAAALHVLHAEPKEWAKTVRWGPVERDLGVAALWRAASHPVALRLGAGRDWATPYGPVRWQRGQAEGEWQGTCAPCRIARPEWGGGAVELPTVAFTLRRGAEGHATGVVTFGSGPQAVSGRWALAMHPTGAELSLALADVPIADGYRLLGTLVPEAQRAVIDGRMDLDVRLQLPSRALAVVPRLRGFQVSGLGTEALVGASSACGAAPADGYGTWLPRAVVAAEDQRFFTHPGFDLEEMGAAWALNGTRGEVVRGGSTLSQQVAKMLFTGADRSPARKLRELLYAVELDRTLGKARLMTLYLAVAPWGEGRCGAAAAARHYLRKEPSALTPMEAAWLASLLHGPDRERSLMARTGRVNAPRVDWVLSQMRPRPPARLRPAAETWMPPGEGLFGTR